jgi:Flp pilus assembly protein protease CpaA
MGEVLITFLLGALALILVFAGIEDARHREIANWKNIAIALLAPLWWWANGLAVWPDIAVQLGVALAVLLFFIGAFAIGQMGGGDVKMLAALALWLPPLPLVWMLALMSLVGGLLTMLMIGDQWLRSGGSLRRSWRPLAVMLGAAAVVAVLLLTGAVDAAGEIERLRREPILWMLVVMTLLCGIAALLLLAARWARRKGVLPETPYGVAIAIAALLVMREPIFNGFG